MAIAHQALAGVRKLARARPALDAVPARRGDRARLVPRARGAGVRKLAVRPRAPGAEPAGGGGRRGPEPAGRARAAKGRHQRAANARAAAVKQSAGRSARELAGAGC